METVMQKIARAKESGQYIDFTIKPLEQRTERLQMFHDFILKSLEDFSFGVGEQKALRVLNRINDYLSKFSTNPNRIQFPEEGLKVFQLILSEEVSVIIEVENEKIDEDFHMQGVRYLGLMVMDRTYIKDVQKFVDFVDDYLR